MKTPTWFSEQNVVIECKGLKYKREGVTGHKEQEYKGECDMKAQSPMVEEISRSFWRKGDIKLGSTY